DLRLPTSYALDDRIKGRSPRFARDDEIIGRSQCLARDDRKLFRNFELVDCGGKEVDFEDFSMQPGFAEQEFYRLGSLPGCGKGSSERQGARFLLFTLSIR